MAKFRKIFALLLVLHVFLVFQAALIAQSAEWLNEEVRFKKQTVSLADALQLLVDEGLSISYRSNHLPAQTISIRGPKRSIENWLNYFLRNTDLTYSTIQKERSLVIFPDPAIVGVERTLYGQVYDASSGERLILANLLIRNRKQGVSTNEDGRYSLRLPGGGLDLSVSYIGYHTKNMQLVLRSDSILNIGLKPAPNLLEVTVTASSDSLIGVLPDAGGIRIGIAEVEQLSGIGGEADPLSVVGLMPGVITGADGVGGINIRGSSADQNLILLDGVPVYNLNHAAGLFSIFNAQAIRRVDLYKNGLPTRFGGRLSGVLDVHTRDGNLYRNELRLSQSLLASRLAVEGPLIPKESSYLLSGRYFWAGALVPGFSRRYKARQGRDGEADYDLYDFNFKLNQKLGQSDRLHFSFYKGADVLSNQAEIRQQITDLGAGGQVFNYNIVQQNAQDVSWGNAVGTIRWNHMFNESFFANVSLSYSNLGMRAGFDRRDSIVEPNTNLEVSSLAAVIFKSDIRQVGFSFDGQWLPKVGREFRFGAQVNIHRFSPVLVASRSVDILSDSYELPQSITYRPLEVNSYAAYVLRRPNLQFRAGLRTQIWYTGAGKSYLNFSPRLLYTRKLSPRLSWQTTFDVTAQAVHLLSNSAIGLPTDIWVPSTDRLRPAQAYQFSTGMKWQPTKEWEFELSGYGKLMEGLVEYLNEENLEGSWEENLSIGDGRAIGLELSARRTEGKLRGWISYTLARTDRRFGAEVNEGNSFPFRYDRLHSISSLLSWHPNARSSLSLSWRFGTGAAYSFGLDYFRIPINDEIQDPRGILGTRNGFRLPAVHRLDINYRFKLKQKPMSKLTHVFNVGLYNAYDRHNEIYYELRTNYGQVRGELNAERSFVKVFIAPVLPIFSYQLHLRGKPRVKMDL